MEAAVEIVREQPRVLTAIPSPASVAEAEVVTMTAWTGEPVRTTVSRSAAALGTEIRGQIPLFAA